MLNAVILTDDKVFERLLALELTSKGIPIFEDASADSANSIYIVDADRISFTSSSDNVIYFGYFDRSAYDQNVKECRFLRRPFDMKHFVSEVADMINSSSCTELYGRLPSDSLRIFQDGHYASFAGNTIKLSPCEYAILTALYENRGKPVSRERLASLISGKEAENALNVYIKYLRNKIDGVYRVKLIHTVRGFGYLMK